MRGWATVAFLVVCLTSIVMAQAPATTTAAESPAAPAAQPADKITSTEAPWDKFTNFSALMTGGPVIGTAEEIHIYRHGNLMRMGGPDGRSYIIQNLKVAGDARAISRADCLQLKYPFTRSFPFSLSWSPNKYETVLLGKETIDGHPTQIQQVTVIFAPEAKHKEPMTLKLWTADDLQGFPIKIETASHRTMEYRKVDFGEMDPTLFIVPGQCEPLDAAKGKTGSPFPSQTPPQKAPPKDPH